MPTILDWRGKENQLSDEIYEIIAVSNPEVPARYSVGSLVRLISGCDGNNIVGYHFAPDHVTVCLLGVRVAEYIGLKRDEIRLVGK